MKIITGEDWYWKTDYFANCMFDDLTRSIVKTIMLELTSRRGLSQEWAAIDDEIQVEILETLCEKVSNLIKERKP